MQLQITLEQLDKLKSRELVALKCEQCNKNFFKPKNDVQCAIHKRSHNSCNFCSRSCTGKYKTIKLTTQTKCLNCNKEFTIKISVLKKSINHFCTSSCSASYRNKNKKSGYRRSKLEIYIEQQLKLDYPMLDIRFNDRSIGYELDIYIPSLKLAFEINGIHHYKPIWKNYKRTIEIDKEKLTTCLEHNIRLFVYDISTVKHFKPEIGLTYLNLIKEQISIGTKC